MLAVVILVFIVGLAVGLRLGRAWAFRRLGGFEYNERIRRSKQGSLF